MIARHRLVADNNSTIAGVEMLTRRRLLMNATALAVAAPRSSFAEASTPTILKLRRRTIEVYGKPASLLGIERDAGVAGIATQVGDHFRVRVENELNEPSLIHWHGMTPPWRQDGVPFVSAPPIPPGGKADYDFPLTFGGTYWMHSHYGFQEQSLMDAPLIILPPGRDADRQEIVITLNDFSFTPAQQIFASLRGRAKARSATQTQRARPMRAMSMPAAAPDLNDVNYDAYLANERTLADPEVVKVENGGRLRLRIINGSAMTNFHVDLGALEGTLAAVDGHDVLPMRGRYFPIACAQRLDIFLDLPKSAEAFPVFFVVEGEKRRAGVVLAPPGASVGRVEAMAPEPSAPLDLTFESQLRAARPLTERKADRVLPIALTGDMAAYVWSINNVVWNGKTPSFPVKAGERVELAMTNRTMMSHPMHLHGHIFQVVEIDGRRLSGAMRDTMLVPPRTRVTIAFDANNPGLWAFHCHLLYHAQAGMFSTIGYV
jgi:FtsP/CotA-like multicopper oxidase with cupredoxin domain